MPSPEPEVWVCGEALIDLVPDRDGQYRAIVGGGPANAAKALANLGTKTYFIGGISNDSYGAAIESELLKYGVDLAHAHRSDLGTALAKVSIDQGGVATYEFTLADTASFDFQVDWLPSSAPDLLYIGSLATIISPGSITLLQWARSLHVPIIFDPNVRPSVLADPDQYRKKFREWIEIARVVKLSIDDLIFLFGEAVSSADLNHLVGEILAAGPELVILTRGSQGLSGYGANLEIHKSAESVVVVDTVGAGDTVGAVLAQAVALNGMAKLMEQELTEVLDRASRAAAITCSRAGAIPPRAAEL